MENFIILGNISKRFGEMPSNSVKQKTKIKINRTILLDRKTSNTRDMKEYFRNMFESSGNNNQLQN